MVALRHRFTQRLTGVLPEQYLFSLGRAAGVDGARGLDSGSEPLERIHQIAQVLALCSTFGSIRASKAHVQRRDS